MGSHYIMDSTDYSVVPTNCLIQLIQNDTN